MNKTMASASDSTRPRLKESIRERLANRANSRQIFGIVLAVFIYILTGILVLFGTAVLVNAEESQGENDSARRARVELTPSAGLSFGRNASSVDTLASIPVKRDDAESMKDVSREGVKKESIEEETAEEGTIEEAIDEKAAIKETTEEFVEKETKPIELEEPAKQGGDNVAVSVPSVLLLASDEAIEPPASLSTLDAIPGSPNIDAPSVPQESAKERISSIESPSVPRESSKEKLTREIVELAVQIDRANADASEFRAADFVGETLELLDGEIEIDALEERAEMETEDLDEEGFAFAYSNPNFSTPSLPNSDFSALGLTPPSEKFSVQADTNEGLNSHNQLVRLPSSTIFPKTPLATPTSAPTQTQTSPHANTIQGRIASTLAPLPVPEQVPSQTRGLAPNQISAQIPAPVPTQSFASAQVLAPTSYPSSGAPQLLAQTPAAPYAVRRPDRVAAPKAAVAVDDHFHAKNQTYFNGKPGGKTFRTFDDSSLPAAPKNESESKRAAPANFSAPGNIGVRNRFARTSRSNVDNPIRQVSAIVRANSYDDEGSDDRNGTPEDVDMPAIVWKPSEQFKSVDTNNAFMSSYSNREEDAPECSGESKLDAQITDKADDSEEMRKEEEIITSSEQKESSSSFRDDLEIAGLKTSQNSVVHEKNSKDDERFFANLRPFKRMREKMQHTQEAPKPPKVDRLAIENRSSVEFVKEPLLTRESEKLPPLVAETKNSYADEYVDENESVYATRSELEAAREEMRGFSWTKGAFKITPYGFLNASVSCDSQRAVPGEYILYAQSKDVDESSGFAVDARTSRLGFKIEGPRVERLNADLGGCFEFDFQGYPNGSKNKGGAQLRRAYVELVDKCCERRFLAGQDWEVISPGAAQMLNYLPMGFAGNIQYRRAQIRYEQGYTVSSDAHFLGQIAICDNVIGDYSSTAGVSPASSGWPILEARVSADLFKESLGGRPVTLGLSGHIGEQYYRFSPISGVPMCSTAEKRAIRTWSCNVDFETPITEKHKIHGEFFMGANLSSFCGGINQGVDLYRREAIGDKGGWLALHSDWTKKFATNIGYGLDKPDKGDLVGTSVASGGVATSRTKNDVYFVNAIYNWTPNFMTGVELGYWQTDYQKADVSGAAPVFTKMKSGDDLRTEFTTRLSF